MTWNYFLGQRTHCPFCNRSLMYVQNHIDKFHTRDLDVMEAITKQFLKQAERELQIKRAHERFRAKRKLRLLPSGESIGKNILTSKTNSDVQLPGLNP
jgi:hypothetical protein